MMPGHDRLQFFFNRIVINANRCKGLRYDVVFIFENGQEQVLGAD